ncbi:YqiA/YcfP family alpha/beta fold hydrolase [Kushneria aurantia]|uniref:YqiA/YcfP family alpha/beta fold hydrolase n=1 Tax=Kushneria aurantia TaxID=504092 RepID=A0ABV6G6L6_9GAMM|nr:YqiA/YcfP family alpha/beta fold hydrolase [Kushneria aurantia]
MSDLVDPVDNVLYLHGFNSHPGSAKAELTRLACSQASPRPRFVAPRLSHHPAQAWQTAREVMAALAGTTLVIGSSMGGFLAIGLAREFEVARLVLINPAVDPLRVARERMGAEIEHVETGEIFIIDESYATALEAQQGQVVHPERMLVLLGTHDEILDYRQALAVLAGSQFVVKEGDDHGLSCYPRLLERIMAHGGLRLPADFDPAAWP